MSVIFSASKDIRISVCEIEKLIRMPDMLPIFDETKN